MKIFISWSGDASHRVAKSLKDWLPNVFQSLDASDVFLSSEDIMKGAPWFHELGQILEQCDFGILCLTSENLRAPWILYEAGAISKRVESARVVPLLIGLKNSDLESPLRDLNAAGIEKEEMRKLVAGINVTRGNQQLDAAKLVKAFDAYWPQLEGHLVAALQLAKAAAKPFQYDVFLSAPMAAYGDDAAFQAGRANFQKVYDALVSSGLRVFWAAKDIKTTADYETTDVSVQADLAALKGSRYFALLYPKSMVTSALFEAGYALALGQPSHYFVRERGDLPYLMKELGSAANKVYIHTQQEWEDYDKLARLLKKQRAVWFPE